MGSETRDRILASAARLFQDHGFHGTSVSAILDDAGVNSGSLYHFFDTKEALLEGVLARHLELLGPTILDPVQAMAVYSVERIGVLTEHYRRALIGSDFNRGCPVGVLALETGDDMPGVRDLINDYFSVWTHRVAEWLDTAQQRLPTEVEHGQVARLVLAVVEGAVMQARAARSIDPYDAAVAHLRIYLERLTQPSAVKPIDTPPSPAGEEIPAVGEQPPETPAWRSW
jgi:AcrR family transcriptional regulator